jgi:hypothetical protein
LRIAQLARIGAICFPICRLLVADTLLCRPQETAAVNAIQGKVIGEKEPSLDRLKARRVRDACRAIGISKSTLYKLASKGMVRLVHIGGRTVVPETEINRLASEGATFTAAPQLERRSSNSAIRCGIPPRKPDAKAEEIDDGIPF